MCHGADSDEAKDAKDGRTTKLDVLDVPYRSDQAGWRFRRQRQELDRGEQATPLHSQHMTQVMFVAPAGLVLRRHERTIGRRRRVGEVRKADGDDSQSTERGPNLERSGDTAPRHCQHLDRRANGDLDWLAPPAATQHYPLADSWHASDAGDIIAPAVSFLNGDVVLLCQTKSAWCANLKRKRP